MIMSQVHRRMPDGIHWTQAAVRFQVNLILTHVCRSRGLPLPGRSSGNLLRVEQIPEEKVKENTSGEEENDEEWMTF